MSAAEIQELRDRVTALEDKLAAFARALGSAARHAGMDDVAEEVEASQKPDLRVVR